MPLRRRLILLLLLGCRGCLAAIAVCLLLCGLFVFGLLPFVGLKLLLVAVVILGLFHYVSTLQR